MPFANLLVISSLAILLGAHDNYDQVQAAGQISSIPLFIGDRDNFTLIRCNETSEFTCLSSSRKCIPIEWRCDFNEQCVDGQDELGCVAEWCDFSRDLCNWRNEPIDFNYDNRLDAHSYPAADVWRRYQVRSSSQSPAANIHLWPPKQEQQAAGSRMQRNLLHQHAIRNESTVYLDERPRSSYSMMGKLDQLAAKTRGSRFVFVPLVLYLRSSADLHTSNRKRTKGEDEVIKSEDSRTVISETKSYKLMGGPLVGQTSSRCQLRFRYALWSNPLPPGERLALSLTLNLTIRHLEPQNQGDQIGSSLWDRTLASFAHDNLNGDAEETVGWRTGVAELGHLRRFELSFETGATLSGQLDRYNRETGKLATSGQLLGSFAALSGLRFQNCAWPLGAARLTSLSLLDGLELDPSSQEPEDADYLSAGDAGSGKRRQPGTGMGVGDGGKGVSNSSDPLEDYGEDCSEVQFQCKASDICLDKRYLCNFVDDCMNGGQDESREICAQVPGMETFEPPSDFSALDGASSGESSRRKLDQSGAGSGLWSLVVASDWPREAISVRPRASSADERDRGLLLPRHDHTLRLAAGHYLSSELPLLLLPTAEKASPNDSNNDDDKFLKGTSLLAAGDASISNDAADGSGALKLSKERKDLARWFYLESDWMRKLEAGECRVKFFYNLVTESTSSSGLVARGLNINDIDEKRATGQEINRKQPPPSISTEQTSISFRLYLAVEHFVLNHHLDLEKLASENVSSYLNASNLINRKLDHLIYSQCSLSSTQQQLNNNGDIIKCNGNNNYPETGGDGNTNNNDPVDGSGGIELAGTDFWREANHKLTDLRDGDTFFVRISVLLEPWAASHSITNSLASAKLDQIVRPTINFDDLSTHFGCARSQPRDQSQRILLQELRNNLSRSLSLIDYITVGPEAAAAGSSSSQGQAAAATAGRRLRNRFLDSCVQFEPHNLIIGVFAVLFTILGLIAMIVFVVVPYVEKITINYHDQLTLGLSEVSGSPRSSQTNLAETTDLVDQSRLLRNNNNCDHNSSASSSFSTSGTNQDVDWERVSRRWRRATTAGAIYRQRQLQDQERLYLRSSVAPGPGPESAAAYENAVMSMSSSSLSPESSTRANQSVESFCKLGDPTSCSGSSSSSGGRETTTTTNGISSSSEDHAISPTDDGDDESNHMHH